jgi:hypothetical protein
MADVTQSNRLSRRAVWVLSVAGLVLSAVLPSAIATASTGQVTASQVLSQIPVKGRAPKTGYSRAQFGSTWMDVDHNGCDTRNDILKRDLTDVVFKAGTHDCVVLSGVLLDPYSGTVIKFTRGVRTSPKVQIDHVVSLSNAWQTGAFKLTLEDRTIFANDPLNLLAVEGKLNSQKGDGDAATWLPPLKSYRCEFVARQMAVKAKYGLWMTSPEQVVITQILKTCPDQTLPK